MTTHVCHDIKCPTCGPRMHKATQDAKARIKAAVEQESGKRAEWRNGELVVSAS